MDKCLGPCELPIKVEVYKKEVDLGLELIQNKKFLLDKLEHKMMLYAEDMRFEEAGQLRDRIERISRSEMLMKLLDESLLMRLSETVRWMIFLCKRYKSSVHKLVTMFMRCWMFMDLLAQEITLVVQRQTR